MSDGTLKHPLPRLIEPRRFTQQSVILRGTVPAGELHRLRESGVIVDRVQAELAFAVDEQREKAVTGQLQVTARQQCQRCLELMPVELVCSINLAIVWDEESSRQLPSSYDPWIVPAEEADLYALVEEEILLNLPYVVYHDTPCTSPLAGLSDGGSDAEKTDKKNPFQVLEQLKETTKK